MTNYEKITLKPTNIPPTDIKICIADAMRVLRLILITSIQPPTNVYETGRGSKKYLENLPRKTIHVVLNDYSSGDENMSTKYKRSKISDLSHQFPKSDE